MKTLYAVIVPDHNITIVRAQSEEEAFDLYARENINDPFFLEEVESMAVNASLMEKFFHDEKGSMFDDYKVVPDRLSQFSEEERQRYEDSWIRKNIRAFWSDRPRFAEEYIEEWEKSKRDENYTPLYTTEFLVDTYKRLAKMDNFYEDFKIVPIDETKTIQELHGFD
ncbi:hypothetical protein IMZ31_18975 (plasmid) [Pontibacillus sp. ALD_SL1]|uniref:hypothetical protein n=1 Tax=Pontibacillus sp. ALD_SL1 TaxID=2777185 RepID=UPI001A962A08|nr:hypothetical protein [Pontibacillus sp. ALD_SL1]QST02633.1 hypothetical protein IMZ31_18975 [Pontibacillus sp. ALD_SL1]